MAEPRDTSATPQHLFSAFELGDSAALGGDVRLEMHERTTVLVGRNGAGKSAILEKLRAGAWGAIGVVDDVSPDPARFACEVRYRSTPDVGVRYECRWQPPEDPPGGDEPRTRSPKSEADLAPIAETCRLIDHGELLWQLDGGRLTRNDGTVDSLPRGRGLLNWWLAAKTAFTFNAMVGPLHDMLLQTGPYLRAGVPRGPKDREAAIVPYPWPHNSSRLERRYEFLSLDLIRLTHNLARDFDERHDQFDEFVELGRRVQIFDDVHVSIVANPEHAADPKLPARLAASSVDGVNLGLLSDGTLRVMAILSALISPKATLILIEEPEIAVHPGLLGRLLKEIDAYSTDRQILMSTQSPQVVSWARPDGLRLVSRAEKRTTIRSIHAEERARIDRYLNDEGTLGDYVYEGGLDG